MAEKKKMGRPTDNPKPSRLGVRVDEKTNAKLDEISLKRNTTKTILVREGIDLIIEKYDPK